MKSNYLRAFLLAAIAVFCLPFAVYSQTNGTIRGTVTSETGGAPVSGVSVTVTQLRRSVETDENGVYEFKDIPAGRYTVVTHLEGFSDRAQTIVVTSGATAAVDFALKLASLREEVTVTATGTEESVYESFQTVTAVCANNIREQASTSIGEVLEREAGIGKRSFGPGTSRPSIRGFEGDRVLVLQDGVRNGSLGSQSGDHGEPVDTLNLERLEIIKGPGTLLYGSNAIGGVVNAVTGDEDTAHPGVRGFLTGLGGTVNKQGGLSGGIEYGIKKFLFTASGSLAREGDFRTPLGTVPNSSSRSGGGSTSIGYYSEKFFLNGNVNFDRRRYGVPYASLFEEGALLTTPTGAACGTTAEPCQYDIFAIRDQFANRLPDAPDEAIDLKMRRNNYRLRGGFRDLGGAIPQGNFYFDYSDYRHQEIETANGVDEVATTFDNDVFSYRTLFQQAKYKNLSGRFGF
jgi:iron complex outermembrane receptor protein